MAYELGRVLDANVARTFTGKYAAPHHDISVAGGSYFRCDPMQDSRKQRVVGVEKPHDFTAHARESSVKSVGVSGIALNKKLEDCRMTADEILRNCD